MSEEDLYASIVHGLRSRGWPKQDAEDEALERLDWYRADRRPTITCGGVGVNYAVTPSGRISFL